MRGCPKRGADDGGQHASVLGPSPRRRHPPDGRPLPAATTARRRRARRCRHRRRRLAPASHRRTRTSSVTFDGHVARFLGGFFAAAACRRRLRSRRRAGRRAAAAIHCARRRQQRQRHPRAGPEAGGRVARLRSGRPALCTSAVWRSTPSTRPGTSTPSTSSSAFDGNAPRMWRPGRSARTNKLRPAMTHR